MCIEKSKTKVKKSKSSLEFLSQFCIYIAIFKDSRNWHVYISYIHAITNSYIHAITYIVYMYILVLTFKIITYIWKNISVFILNIKGISSYFFEIILVAEFNQKRKRQFESFYGISQICILTHYVNAIIKAIPVNKNIILFFSQKMWSYWLRKLSSNCFSGWNLQGTLFFYLGFILGCVFGYMERITRSFVWSHLLPWHVPTIFLQFDVSFKKEPSRKWLSDC